MNKSSSGLKFSRILKTGKDERKESVLGPAAQMFFHASKNKVSEVEPCVLIL